MENGWVNICGISESEIFANGEHIELIRCGVGVDGMMVGVGVAGKVGVTEGIEIVGDGVDVIGDSEHALI